YKEDGIRCSFCGKSQEEVRRLIAGPAAYICDECIDLCNDIILEEGAAEQVVKKKKTVIDQKNLRMKLDQIICGHEKAKGKLVSTFFLHLCRLNSEKRIDRFYNDINKSNILIVGPYGSGKNIIAKSMAKICDLSFVEVKSTFFMRERLEE